MDIITYVSNLGAYRADIRAEAEAGNPKFIIDENNNVVYIGTKRPTHYNGNQSLCLIRGDMSDFANVTTLVRLGECINNEYIFDTPEDEATYDRVRGDLTYTYIDENGVEQTGTKTRWLGAFA